MKYKRFLYVIMLSIAALIVNAGISYAEPPTAGEILQRNADNAAGVQDMKAKGVYNGSFQGNPYPADEERLIWIKHPDKSKIMSLSTGKAEIMNGNMRYIIDVSTESVSMEGYGVSNNQLDYTYHLDDFMAANSVTLIDSEVIDGDNVYTIEITPNEENVLYSKIVMSINYEKGLIVKKELYDYTEYKASTEEMLEYQTYTVGELTINQPTKMKHTLHFDDGEIINEVEYQDIEFNTGIDDSLFEVEE